MLDDDLAPLKVWLVEPMNAAAPGLDDVAVALDHGADLFALVRMNQEDDLEVSHRGEAPYGLEPPARAVRQGVDGKGRVL